MPPRGRQSLPTSRRTAAAVGRQGRASRLNHRIGHRRLGLEVERPVRSLWCINAHHHVKHVRREGLGDSRLEHVRANLPRQLLVKRQNVRWGARSWRKWNTTSCGPIPNQREDTQHKRIGELSSIIADLPEGQQAAFVPMGHAVATAASSSSGPAMALAEPAGKGEGRGRGRGKGRGRGAGRLAFSGGRGRGGDSVPPPKPPEIAKPKKKLEKKTTPDWYLDSFSGDDDDKASPNVRRARGASRLVTRHPRPVEFAVPSAPPTLQFCRLRLARLASVAEPAKKDKKDKRGQEG